MDRIEQQKIKEAKELLERYAPKGEFLAYINEKEAGLLEAYGGAGKPIEETNIPSFVPWITIAIVGAIAASTAVSFMGSLHQARNLRRSMKADQRNAEERALQLGFIAAQKGRKKLSLQRAMTGISGTQMGTGSIEPMHPRLGMAFALAEQYGEAVGVGGSTNMYTGSITLSSSKQVYDLETQASLEKTGDRLEIQRVFNYGPAAITRFYDPFAGSFDQRRMLDDMGMGNVSPSVSFIMRPLHQDISRANAIETNDRIRKSAYSFELINNKLRIFPIPKSSDMGNKVYFQYYLRDEKTANSETHTINKVSDPSNVPYKFITYSEINAAGRQWIRKMTLALAKELLGIIRSKYASMPLPNGEVSLDGEGLKAEGREEKTNLLEELKEFLESVSLSERARLEQEQAEANQAVLAKAPLQIYIG